MKYSLIIDGFNTHNSLAEVSSNYGIIPIHIFSSKESFHTYFNKVESHLYKTCFIFETPEKFLNEIQSFKHNILFSVACTESAQQCKDLIDEMLSLDKSNDKTFSNVRYDKFHLYQLLGQNSSKNNFKEFIEHYKNCIVKPYDIRLSGGLVDVYFRDTYNPKDENGKLFISQYFEGDEYSVDLVSSKGKHKLVAVWKYIRNNDEKIWKPKIQLIDPYEEVLLIDSIYKAVTGWLNALNHQFGPTHIEIKVKDNQFFCIEINFRLQGHMPYIATSKALEYTQHSLTIECYTNKFPYNSNLSTYKINGFISKIFLLNDRERLSKNIKWKDIENSKSVQQVYITKKSQVMVPIARKNLSDITGMVVFFNKDKEQLLNDEAIVTRLFEE